jgi:hypothetical protein
LPAVTIRVGVMVCMFVIRVNDCECECVILSEDDSSHQYKNAAAEQYAFEHCSFIPFNSTISLDKMKYPLA